MVSRILKGDFFYPVAPTKKEQIIRKWKISRHREELMCIPSNNQQHCCLDEKHTCNKFLDTSKYGKKAGSSFVTESRS